MGDSGQTGGNLRLRIIRFSLLSIYLFVNLITGISHNHDPDFTFHDNCPACQWNIQSQDDDHDTNEIHAALLDPLVIVERLLERTTPDYFSPYYPDSNPSRAPPSSTF